MPFQKGNPGRKAGTPNKNTAQVRALALKAVPAVLKELKRLSTSAENEATRVAASKELLDRAIGKAVQPHSGEDGVGPVLIQVITGVPRDA